MGFAISQMNKNKRCNTIIYGANKLKKPFTQIHPSGIKN
jgi:hypothetical protein